MRSGIPRSWICSERAFRSPGLCPGFFTPSNTSDPASVRVEGYGRPRSARWLADGRVVGFGIDGRAEIWQAAAGRRQRRLPARSRTGVSAVGARDRRLLTYDYVAGLARIWDIDSGHEVATIPVDSSRQPHVAAYSDDGSTIVFSDDSHEVEVWRAVDDEADH